MLALSLWQPWASLIAWGAKQYETRSWETAYRGLLVIHAAQRDRECKELARQLMPANSPLHSQPSVFSVMYRKVTQIDPLDLPHGAGLCIVRLVDCIPTEKAVVSDQECTFGDYTPGRLAWKLELIEVFPQPIPAIGRQKLFGWTEGGIAEKPTVMSQLALPLFSGS